MTKFYVVQHSATVSTGITIIQIKAAAGVPLEIVRASVTQRSSTTSAQAVVQLLRKSAAATVTSYTPLLLDPADAAAAAVGGTSATGITATSEGTDGDILWREAFNILSGVIYLPVPEERIRVAGGGIIGLKFAAAPTSATYDAQVVFREL